MAGSRIMLLVALSAMPFFGAPVAAQPGLPILACADPRGCPDLIADPETMSPRFRTESFPPNSCDVVEGMVQPGTRSLVRFTFTTPNQGPGDLIIGPPSLRPDLFEYHACHGHYHFREFADYRLWTPEQFAVWDVLRNASPHLTPAEVLAAHPELSPVEGAKRGFCLVDLRQYDVAALPKYESCDLQGISVGWADEYNWTLSGQYVDVTGLAPGGYVVETEVNAERLFGETNYANNRAWISITI